MGKSGLRYFARAARFGDQTRSAQNKKNPEK
jgi:hypothetical protein